MDTRQRILYVDLYFELKPDSSGTSKTMADLKRKALNDLDIPAWVKVGVYIDDVLIESGNEVPKGDFCLKKIRFSTSPSTWIRDAIAMAYSVYLLYLCPVFLSRDDIFLVFNEQIIPIHESPDWMEGYYTGRFSCG